MDFVCKTSSMNSAAHEYLIVLLLNTLYAFIYSHTIGPCIQKARAKITVFTREMTKYTLHHYRTTDCKGLLLVSEVWLKLNFFFYWLLASSVWTLAAMEYGREATHQDIQPCFICAVWFPHCSVCILYAASIKYLAPGKESSPAVSQCLSTCTAYVTGKLCALYICISCVFAAETSLFIDITSNWSVGLCFSYPYAQKRLMNA